MCAIALCAIMSGPPIATTITFNVAQCPCAARVHGCRFVKPLAWPLAPMDVLDALTTSGSMDAMESLHLMSMELRPRALNAWRPSHEPFVK